MKEVIYGLILGTVIFFAITGAMCFVAHGQESPAIHHHEGMSQGVDEFLSTWMQPPDRQISCCSKDDCHPTPIRITADGRFEGQVEGQWWPINEGRVEEENADFRESPSSDSWACYYPVRDENDNLIGVYFYCAVRGSGI